MTSDAQHGLWPPGHAVPGIRSVVDVGCMAPVRVEQLAESVRDAKIAPWVDVATRR
jgi:hypothetical protein